MKQFGLYFAGAGFMLISTMITRRAIIRKKRIGMPKYFESGHSISVERPMGALDALEALNLATLNVLSFGVLLTGGLSWAFDVSSVEDMRRRMYGPSGRRDEAAEKAVEEWAARVLSRTNRVIKTDDSKKAEGNDGKPREQ